MTGCVAALVTPLTAALGHIALTMSLWYVALTPRFARRSDAPDKPGGLSSILADLAFLAIIPAVVLGGYFDSIYPPYMGQKLNVLGHVTFLPVVVLVLMLERRVRETGSESSSRTPAANARARGARAVRRRRPCRPARD